MVTLENSPRPDAQGNYYRFFRNTATDTVFKAKQEARTAADGSPAISISISPVNDDGKALLDPIGQPDVHVHTHTFTAAELAAPDFDMNARISEILNNAVAAKESQLAVRSKLESLGDSWGGDTPIDL